MKRVSSISASLFASFLCLRCHPNSRITLHCLLFPSICCPVFCRLVGRSTLGFSLSTSFWFTCSLAFLLFLPCLSFLFLPFLSMLSGRVLREFHPLWTDSLCSGRRGGVLALSLTFPVLSFSLLLSSLLWSVPFSVLVLCCFILSSVVSGRVLREFTLSEPIHYAVGDPVESWLYRLPFLTFHFLYFFFYFPFPSCTVRSCLAWIYSLWADSLCSWRPGWVLALSRAVFGLHLSRAFVYYAHTASFAVWIILCESRHPVLIS